MDRISFNVREGGIGYGLLLPDCEGFLFPSPSCFPTRMAGLRCETVVCYQDVLVVTV